MKKIKFTGQEWHGSWCFLGKKRSIRMRKSKRKRQRWCRRCNFNWESNNRRPLYCPHCRSNQWDIPWLYDKVKSDATWWKKKQIKLCLAWNTLKKEVKMANRGTKYCYKKQMMKWVVKSRDLRKKKQERDKNAKTNRKN